MEDMRDLVSSEGCDPGQTRKNPLTRFVDHMYRDRSQRELGEYRSAPQRTLNNKFEERLGTQTNQVQGRVSIAILWSLNLFF